MCITIVTKTIKNPYKVRFYLYRKLLNKFVGDQEYLEFYYAAAFGQKMDFNNPITYNQKLQWLKLFYHNPDLIKLVDKIEVKSYVADKIGRQYIVPTIGVYDRVEDIDFDKLPKQFVLKCNHDSGSVCICRDRKEFCIEKVIDKLSKRLRQNPYWDNREWPYKNVKPRILCEEYIGISGQRGLTDYKFMCFNGEPKCVFTVTNRFAKEDIYVDFFDLKWDHMPFERHYHNNPVIIPPPENLGLMIDLSRKLSTGLPHVRVDFYEANGKVYFGELTFFPGSGVEEFTPESYDELFGSWLKLPEKMI